MKKGLGLVLVLLAVGIGTVYMLYFQKPGDTPAGGGLLKPKTVETVKIRYGSEKKGFLHDPEIAEILRDKYGVAVDGTKMGSLEMSAGSIEGIDALWPSSDLAALLFTARHPGVSHKKTNMFSTPIVFYSWPEVTDALMQAGLVKQRDGVYYLVQLKTLLEKMLAKESWKSLALPYQTGVVSVRCTDPRKSNSGYLLSGLLAIVMNQGLMVESDSIEAHLPSLVSIFKSMGYMENSSGILFDKYIKQGQGAFPLIANYESLMIEFYRAYPEHQELIKKNIRVLVPEPTVWSEHPLVALTPKGEKLMAALQDETVQQLAWSRFGFRSGVMGIGMDMAILKELNLPERIQSVTVMPSAEVMERILAALQ